jgi:Zn-dependent protease
MFKSWRLGRLLGFPVEINASFLILLAVAFFAFGGALGVFVVGLAFASVLLHELGHALVARHLGVPVSGIELSFFGGAAKMTDVPRTSRDEIAIAAAGPIVSLVLAGIGLGLGLATHSPWVSLVGWINLVIAGFNLIPALPMDGGRILRALLARRMDYVRATDVSVAIARVAAVGFVVWGIAASAFQLVVLAPFLWIMGTREKQVARMMAPYLSNYGGGTPTARPWPRDEDWLGRSFQTPHIRRFTITERNGRLVVTETD